jgi:hypothetical protein
VPKIGTAGEVIELSGLTVPGQIISALSELKISTVPNDQFPLYVTSFSFEQESGVEWHILRIYFQKAGSRLAGTLAAYFIDCSEGRIKKADATLSIEIPAFLNSEKGKHSG